MGTLDPDIHYFIAAATEGSLVRAAQSLGLTQPALTKAIKRLEKHLGVTLFVRTPRGSELTDAGRAFYARVRTLSNAMDDAVMEARDLGGGHAGLLRLGITPAVSHFVLSALFPTLTTERPAAHVKVTTAFGDVLMGAIERKELGLAVCPLSDDLPAGIEVDELYDDPFSAILNSSHPLARRERLTMADMNDCQWVASSKQEVARRSVEQAVATQGLPRLNIPVETNSLEALYTVVSRTNMVSLYNARFGSPTALPANVVVIPIDLPGVQRRVGILRRRGYLSPIAQRAREILLEASARQTALSGR
ncbi:MAG: LysR family transcriptional regulator [Rubrivivax sp.]|nr:MAG: LysR family transcriptional regulator [Rubrivivax sp.]